MAQKAGSVEIAALDDRERWDAFVGAHPTPSYSHLFAWRRVAENAYGRTCVYLASTRQSRLTGVLPLVWMPGRLAGNRLVSMPYLDLGGPLATDAESAEALSRAAVEQAKRLSGGLVELRESALEETHPSSAAHEQMRFRFLLPLPRDEDELWSKIGPKVRNQARKAEKSGLRTERAEPGRLRDFYGVFARNMRDLGSPVHAARFFVEIFEQLGDAARLYLTSGANGDCVAGAIAIACGRELVVPWASSLRSERPRCPNHSLYWRILREAIAEGHQSFDFGRSSLDSGTYRFKKQWGAEARPLAWRLLDGDGERPADSALSGGRNSGLVSVWRRLPLPVANLLGPRIRGRLPH